MRQVMKTLSAHFELNPNDSVKSQAKLENKEKINIIKEEYSEDFICMYLKLLDEERRRWLMIKFKEVYCSDVKFENIGNHKFFIHRNLTKKLKSLIFRDDTVYLGLDGHNNLYVEIIFTLNEHEGVQGDDDYSYLTATLDLNKVENDE